MCPSAIITPLMALQKMRDWCAYQERCHSEVEEKLYNLGMRGEHVGEILSQLISEGFLDEERFAKAYARGKFRIKKWGKLKIKQGLKQKRVSEYSIKKGLKEIDEQEYENALINLFEKKLKEVKGQNQWQRIAKIQKFLASKGYEFDLIQEVMKSKFQDE